jgi:spore coat protein U-like protein
MKLKLTLWLAALALLLSATLAQAGTCAVTISSPSITIAYVPGNPTNPISSTMSTTCTKTGGNTDTYTVAANSTGVATSGANTLNYSVSTSSSCSGNTWNALNPFSFSFTANGTQTRTFYVCIATGQNVAAGTYTGTVPMTSNTGGGVGSFTVTILAPATCNITSVPTVLFTYTSFQTSDATPSTTFGVNCTNTLPYTMAVSPAGGTLAGISYSLSLPVASSTGTGVTQTHTINGTALAGQIGTCATATCSATQSTSLTITY